MAWVCTTLEMLGDGLTVGGQLLVELGDGLLVGGHPGLGHRGLLLGGVLLELFQDQIVGDGGRLGLEIGDGVGPGGARRGPHGEHREDGEGGKAEDPDESTGRPRGVWPRQRGRTGVQHKAVQFTGWTHGEQAGVEPLVTGPGQPSDPAPGGPSGERGGSVRRTRTFAPFHLPPAAVGLPGGRREEGT